MAMSAKFQADFSAFKTAVEQAEVTLKSFETDAAKVGDRLDRMGDQFSGVKVIQQAEMMTKAIAEIGGATKLTDSEMARVNATVSEAIEKYGKLGMEAPADMVALAKATEQTKESTEGYSTSIVALGTFIGNMATKAVTALTSLAVEGFTNLVTSIDDFLLKGSEVADISENFENLTAAAGQTGETLLGVLAEGTHQTVDNLTLMKSVNADLAAGMRLSEAQYRTLAQGAFALAQATGVDVTQALGQMSDAMLTGRTRSVELLTGKIDLKKAEEDYAASIGAGNRQLDENEKIEAARVAIINAVGGAVERLGAQTDGLDERVAQARAGWENFTNELGKTIATSPVLEAAMTAIADSLKAAFGGDQKALIAAIRDGVDALAMKVVDAGLVMIEWGKTGASVFGVLQIAGQGFADAFITVIERITAGNAAIAELAAKIPGTGEAFQKVADDARAMADSWAASRAESAKTLEAARNLMSGHSALHDVLTKGTEILVNTKAAMTAASLATDRQTESTKAATAALPALTAATTAAAAATKTHAEASGTLETIHRELYPTFEPLKAAVESTGVAYEQASESVATFRVEVEASALEAEAAAAVVQASAEQVSLSWSEAMDLVRQGKGTMGGTLPPVSWTPERRAETQKAFDEGRYWGPVREGTWGLEPDWAAIGAEARAAGGPVRSGNPYVVGERGPELFVPSTGGAVLPSGGGAMNVTINVNGSVLGNKQEIARVVGEALMASLRGAGMRLPVGA
jgi:hypothetical protein